MKYEIKITRNVQKSLAKIEKKFRDRIVEKIYELQEDPYKNAKKLTGREAYRIRIGRYRVIYEIHDEELVVIVINIGHRRDIYKI